jgi:hypothetical protein
MTAMFTGAVVLDRYISAMVITGVQRAILGGIGRLKMCDCSLFGGRVGFPTRIFHRQRNIQLRHNLVGWICPVYKDYKSDVLVSLGHVPT